MTATKWPERMILVVPERSAEPEWHCDAHPGPLAGTSCRYVRDDVAMSAALDRIAMAGWMVVPKDITQEMTDELCYDTTVEELQPYWERAISAAPKFDPEVM